jgi:hypothetical protein
MYLELGLLRTWQCWKYPFPNFFALKLHILSIMRPDTICRKNMGKFVWLTFDIFITTHKKKFVIYFGIWVLLYCIHIFVNNRDQGFATFLTLNTTCIWESSKKKFGRKYFIWENLNLKQRYRVYYKISI